MVTTNKRSVSKSTGANDYRSIRPTQISSTNEC